MDIEVSEANMCSVLLCSPVAYPVKKTEKLKLTKVCSGSECREVVFVSCSFVELPFSCFSIAWEMKSCETG